MKNIHIAVVLFCCSCIFSSQWDLHHLFTYIFQGRLLALVHPRKLCVKLANTKTHHNEAGTGLILGLCPANERRRYFSIRFF